MTDITNAQAIRWANEQLRPFAEYTLRGFIRADEFVASFDEAIAPILAAHADGDLLADGREAEGVSRLTKADITGFMAVIKALQAGIDGSRGTIRKPAVRSVIE